MLLIIETERDNQQRGKNILLSEYCWPDKCLMIWPRASGFSEKDTVVQVLSLRTTKKVKRQSWFANRPFGKQCLVQLYLVLMANAGKHDGLKAFLY